MSTKTVNNVAENAVEQEVVNTAANAATVTTGQEQENAENAEAEASVETVRGSIFDRVAKRQISTVSKEELAIKKLMDSGNCSKFTVDVQDVLPDDPDKRKTPEPCYTLSFKQEVYGMVDCGERDGFSNVIKEVGPTRGLMFSLIDLRTAAKRDARSAFVISGITAIKEEDTQLALIQRTFIGAKLTIIQEYVKAGRVHVNHFSSKQKENVWNEDKVITYIIGYKPGQTLIDSYNKNI